jgi:hypothetical protein
MPVIVSYFTKGTEYESLAARLADSCETLDLEYHLISRAPFGSWEEHCAAKAEVCLRAWQELRRPILWVDADAIINRPPNLLRGCGADFAVHRWDRWQIASGTIFFGQSALAEALLQEWVERCRRHPTTWDQVHLDFAWEHVSCVSPLHTIWLPRAYCQIYDRRSEEGHTTVIEHYQASRRHRRSSSADGAPAPSVTAALFHARRAARPRRSRLPGPDSQDFAKELEAERRLESITYSLEDTVALAAHSGVRTPVEGQIAMTTNAPLITCDR